MFSMMSFKTIKLEGIETTRMKISMLYFLESNIRTFYLTAVEILMKSGGLKSQSKDSLRQILVF